MATARVILPVPKNQLMRILVVDDELPVAEEVRDILADAGYAVDIAASPDEGVDKLANSNYQLVISDQLFEKTQTRGDDFLIQNESLMPNAKRVIMTGQSLEGIKRRVELKQRGVPILVKGEEKMFDEIKDIADQKLEEEKHTLATLLTNAVPVLEKAEQVLISWLETKAEPDKRGLFYGGRSYSPNMLIREIAERTDVGRAFLDMFFDLIQDRLGI
jgi:CheY-like chemotaxis protein